MSFAWINSAPRRARRGSNKKGVEELGHNFHAISVAQRMKMSLGGQRPEKNMKEGLVFRPDSERNGRARD